MIYTYKYLFTNVFNNISEDILIGVLTMEAHTKLNGSYTPKNNFIWGAALTLAWKKLCQEIIKEPIKVQSDDKTVNSIVDNFNKSQCDFSMLSDYCYYARAGYGNKTVALINQQVKQKFPEKTTPPITANVPDNGIISFAYFFKKLLFDCPFKKQEVYFNGKYVSGFTSQAESKHQVIVGQYEDDDNFLLQLKTKLSEDHLLILKSGKNLTPQQVLEKVHHTKRGGLPIESDEHFSMPKIAVRHQRDITQLSGVCLANNNFKNYYFSQIYEIINLDLDEKGVKVENQGAILMVGCCMPVKKPRRFYIDKPFWIVMQEEDKHPYFVAHIVNLDDK